MAKRMMIVFLWLIVTACTLVSGCSSRASPDGSVNTVDVSEVAKQYYKDVRWALPEGPLAKHIDELDRYAFLRQHRDEMLKTLEVVETAETQNIAVAFVRYSIGATIYRDAVWMRKVDGVWRACLSQFFSEYEDDPFMDGKPDAAKKLIKRVEEWQKASPGAWW